MTQKRAIHVLLRAYVGAPYVVRWLVCWRWRWRWKAGREREEERLMAADWPHRRGVEGRELDNTGSLR